MLAALFIDPSNLDLESLPWESLIQQASDERLLPALADRLSAPEIRARLPAEIQTLFTAAETLNAERNQAILAEAAHAAALLNQIGLQPVALKGLAYLLTGTYPNPAARYLLDIDLLLPLTEIDRAFQHLLQNGYTQTEPDDLLPLRHHYPPLRRPGAPTIELHHQLALGPGNRLLPAATLLAQSTPLNAFLLPSPTHLINHLILHSQLHHPYAERIFPPLKSLLDLTRLQNRFQTQIDWQALSETYRQQNQYATLLLHLHQAHQILGFPLPPSIPARLSLPLRLRLLRRTFLNHHPAARFFDPTYLIQSLLTRRLRLLPLLFKTRKAWPQLLHHLTRPAFLRNLIP